MELDSVTTGTLVMMDTEKFPKHVDIAYVVDCEPIRVQSGPDEGRHFVWLVTRETAELVPSRRKRRTAWTTDLRAL